MSMKFGRTKGTEGLLKPTNWCCYINIWGYGLQQYLEKQPKKARPVMHWLLANACVFLVSRLLHVNYVTLCSSLISFRSSDEQVYD